MYVDSVIEVDRSNRPNCYLLTVKNGRKAQRINRTLGRYYDCLMGLEEEAVFHLNPTALLVALLAAGKDKAWARSFTASLT